MRHAVAIGWPSVAIVAASWPFASNLAWQIGVGLTLIAASLWLVWRGGSPGRAVGPALAAGVIPLVLPLVAMRAICATPSCGTSCLAACLVGGAAAGAWFGLRAASDPHRGEFVAAGALIAGLAGSLGCVYVGGAGVVGMFVAFAGAALPLAFARTRPA